MSWFTLLAIALGLSMDAFAVAISAGLAVAPITPRHTFRIAFHFGLFQFLMPVLGWLAGNQLDTYISGYDHWVAFGLLSYVGGKMLWESREAKKAADKTDPTRGLMLVTLSVATSLDALAVGLSMAFLYPKQSIWGPSITIGLITAGLSTIGIVAGSRLGALWGRWAEAIGGVVLLGIGLRLLLSHVTSS